ncbi:MAG TPA: ATP-binding protein [Burkholderiaceae bacterium]|nr:ATP-binding protein [Burkholderiaceae bacterium]
MTPVRLLLRQLSRSCGIQSPEALADMLGRLGALDGRDDVPADLLPLLAGLPRLLAQVNDTYVQHERDLNLSHRSLEISSQELTQANRRLFEEARQMQRSVTSLRRTLDQLSADAGGVFQDEASASVAGNGSTTSGTADLESIAQQVGKLVEANALSRQMLHASEERLALAVQGSNIGLWDWNLVNNHVHFSREWAQMLGYAQGDLAPESETLISLLHPDDAITFGESIGAHFAQRTDATFVTDVRLRCKDGAHKWIEFKGHVVQYDTDGEPMRATGISTDVSARKSWEQAMAEARAAAEAASKAKGDFLANMSHEIRTPMNGILGLTELCLGTQLTDEQRTYLDMVHGSARALLTVINDVLDFSKIEANKLDIEHLPFDLPQVLRHALAPLQTKATQQHLTLASKTGPGVTEWVVGDAGRLRQVLVNLVGNAVKFTEGGEVSVEVTRVERPTNATAACDQWVRFAVTDTGIGMSAEQVASVFEAFSQADSSISRRFGGTGLGLTISARLVELMGGHLQVRSQLGKGSTFWFELPLPVGQAPEVDTREQMANLPTGLQVLVAEDHPVNQVVARKVLEFLGQHVTLVANGIQAVEAVTANRYDLVFMDIQMPEMDGFEATRHIRLLELGTGARVPIIAMTAHAMEGYRERCVAGGMDGYVTKPVDRKQLVQEMQRLMSRRPAAGSGLVQH